MNGEQLLGETGIVSILRMKLISFIQFEVEATPTTEVIVEDGRSNFGMRIFTFTTY
jgi:hypothetical protein